MKIPQDITSWVATSMKGLELTEAPLTVEVALAVAQFTSLTAILPIASLPRRQKALI